jgi:hypothetical protein
VAAGPGGAAALAGGCLGWRRPVEAAAWSGGGLGGGGLGAAARRRRS